jgi:raffinose/stachyose/melibiose transport system substrate-binding protein
MNKTTRLTALLVSAAVAALGLAACNDPGASKTKDDNSTGPGQAEFWPEPEADLAGVELTFWVPQSAAEIPKSVVAAFEKATGAEIEMVVIPDPYEQNTQTKVASGDKPDLGYWQSTASMLTAINASANLQALDDQPWAADLKPGMGDFGALNGTQYAVLVSSPATMGVFYNKQVFANAGITDLPANWTQLVAAAEKIKATGVAPLYDMGADKWGTQWGVQIQLADAATAGLWDRVNTGAEKFTDPTIQDAISRYKKLQDDGLFNADVASGTFEGQAAALLDGSAGMAFQINALYSEIIAAKGDSQIDDVIGFFPLSTDSAKATNHPDTTNFIVAYKTGDEKREAATRQFLRYWMESGYADYIAEQAMVSLKTSVPDPADIPALAGELAAALADSTGSMQAQAVVNPDLYLNLADMLAGALTPQEVAAATQDQFAQLAKAAGVSGF